MIVRDKEEKFRKAIQILRAQKVKYQQKFVPDQQFIDAE